MIEGTRDLLDAAKAAGVKRFVLMSALGTNEETKDLVPYYGAKWAEEQDVKASGIPYVIFRPSFVFGKDGGILPTFAKLAKVGAGDRRSPATGSSGSSRSGSTTSREYFAESRSRSTTASAGRGSWAGPTGRLERVLGAAAARARHQAAADVHMPMWFMRANAVVTERLPGNIPLTRDLLKMLEAGDNVRPTTRRRDLRRQADARSTSSCAAALPRKESGPPKPPNPVTSGELVRTPAGRR